jgi:CHAT domain-containing protein/tetratricopeptide (TPR) repeat protein
MSTDKEFAPKAVDVVGLYLNPPLNAVVLSVYEKPSIQAIERASGYVETDSGKVLRGLKSTYKRHGTLNLFAALEVGTGQVKTKFTEFKKREDFCGFLDGVLADQPPHAEIHVILDNYSPHKRNDDWLAKFEERAQFHFKPTSASWLDQIAIVFSLLQRKTLNGASFKTKDQLREAIEAFFRRHSERAKPFRWRKRDVNGSQLKNTVINLRNSALALRKATDSVRLASRSVVVTRRSLKAHVVIDALMLLLAASAICSAQSQPVNSNPEANPFYAKLGPPWKLYYGGKLDDAAAGFRHVLEEAAAAGDQQALGWSHVGLGMVLDAKAQYSAARTEYEQALALFEIVKDELDAAHTQAHLGIVAFYMGDMVLARKHFHSALETWRRLNLLRDEANALGQLSLAGDPDWQKLDEEELAIARQIGDKGLEADVLHRNADRLFNAGEFDSAQEQLTRAAALYQEVGGKWELARVLTSEGRLERAHGHPEKALQLYRDALKLQQEIGDRQGEIQSTNAIAIAYSYLNDHAGALEMYERALSLAKETGSERIINFQSGNLAGSLMSVGRDREAVEILEKVLSRDQDYPDERYGSLAIAYMHLGRNVQAKEAANKAVEVARARGHIDFLPKALLDRALAESLLGERIEAIADAQDTLRVIEQMRSHLVPTDFMKRGFTEATLGAFNLTIRLLSDAHQSGQALEVAEQARSRAFLDLLATRDLQGARGQGSPALGNNEGELILAGAGSSLAAPPASGSALPKQWINDDSEMRSPVSVQSMSLGQIQATARRLNSTILSYWVADNATYIWVVPPSGEIHSARAEIPEKKLRQVIAGLWPGNTASVRGEEPAIPSGVQVNLRGGDTVALSPPDQANWRELYRLLIGPVEKWLPARAGSLLTIEPGGPLLELPFAGLRNQLGQYLIERFTLHSVPAISLLEFTEKKKKQVAKENPSYLLVADPTNTPLSPEGKSLPALPGARREIESIARLMPAIRVTKLEGVEASEPRVEELARRSTVIHLATHGVIQNDHPLDSFLALGRAGSDPDHDGHLTVQKVYSLSLHSDLVFLSACRSGRGEVSGDGINGLTRAFLYAGTPSVIASIWDVADATADRLVAGFYRSWLRGGDKAHSLRSAQLGLLQALRAGQLRIHTPSGDLVLPEHPMFWASFVLEGEP